MNTEPNALKGHKEKPFCEKVINIEVKPAEKSMAVAAALALAGYVLDTTYGFAAEDVTVLVFKDK